MTGVQTCALPILIETIQETLRIQKEGKEKRRHAEVELGHMEEDLKQKLLDLTQ